MIGMTLVDEGLFLQPSCRPGILTLTVSWQSHHARRTVSPVPSLSPWPAHVILTFGWRSLNVNLPLSADHGRFAEYLVNENTLKDCGACLKDLLKNLEHNFYIFLS